MDIVQPNKRLAGYSVLCRQRNRRGDAVACFVLRLIHHGAEDYLEPVLCFCDRGTGNRAIFKYS